MSKPPKEKEMEKKSKKRRRHEDVEDADVDANAEMIVEVSEKKKEKAKKKVKRKEAEELEKEKDNAVVTTMKKRKIKEEKPSNSSKAAIKGHKKKKKVESSSSEESDSDNESNQQEDSTGGNDMLKQEFIPMADLTHDSEAEEDSDDHDDEDDDDSNPEKSKSKKSKPSKAQVYPLPSLTTHDEKRIRRAIQKRARMYAQFAQRKLTRRLKEMRNDWEMQQKSNDEIEKLMNSNPEYIKLKSDFEEMKSFPFRLLAQHSWIYYWEGKHKDAMKFPIESMKLSPRICDFLRLGIFHSTIQNAFQECITAHLNKLKRTERKKEKVKARDAKKEKDKKAVIDKAKADSENGKTGKSSEKKGSNYPGCLKIGTTVDGIVENIVKHGIFVYFIHDVYELKGFIPQSEAGNFNRLKSSSSQGNKYSDLSEQFFAGDKVKCVVLKIDAENRRITLSLREQFFPQGEKPELQHIEDYAEKLSEFKMEKVLSTHTGDNQFVSALQDDASAARQQLVAKMRAFLALSKGIVPAGRNRMGQRDRKKLAKTLYGKAESSSIDV